MNHADDTEAKDRQQSSSGADRARPPRLVHLNPVGPVYGLTNFNAPPSQAEMPSGVWRVVAVLNTTAARLPLRGQHRRHTCFPFNLGRN